MGAVWQRLYDNDEGFLDAYGRFWRRVAARFKAQPPVIAYEVLNEPWYGEVPLKKGGFRRFPFLNDDVAQLPAHADRANLARMNRAVHDAVRVEDDRTVLLFEPGAGGAQQITSAGFTEGPGGPAYDGKQAYAYHMYCFRSVNSHRKGWNPPEDLSWWQRRLRIAGCEARARFRTWLGARDAKRAGAGAAFVTEFGDVNNDEVGLAALRASVHGMARHGHSWTVRTRTQQPPEAPRERKRETDRSRT